MTWLGPDGQRSELSVSALLNSAIKTANLLGDVYELGPGDTITLRLPHHWQVPVWLSAIDVVGAHVILLPPGAPAPHCTATVDADPRHAVESSARLAVAVSTHPLGLPGDVPEGVIDHAREMLGQPDELVTELSDGLRLTTTDQGTLSGADIVELARGPCRDLGARGRLLSAVPPWTTPGVLAAWAVPILAESCVVLADAAAGPIAESERITHIARNHGGTLKVTQWDRTTTG